MSDIKINIANSFTLHYFSKVYKYLSSNYLNTLAGIKFLIKVLISEIWVSWNVIYCYKKTSIIKVKFCVWLLFYQFNGMDFKGIVWLII